MSKNNTPLLLFVTHINFWEKDLGSRMRLYNMLNFLKTYFAITIVYTQKRQENDSTKLKETGYKEQVVFLDELNESEVDQSKINTFLSTHSVLIDFYDPSLYKKMQTYINAYHCDNIIIEYIQFSYFLPLFESKPCFLDSHDIMNIRNSLFKKNHQKHWIDISEAQEFALFKMYKKILAIQQNEHNYLIKNNIESLLVPYSYPATKGTHKMTIKSLVFIGGDSQANIEAINWFISEVWPLFAHCGLRLEIYGSVSQSVQGESKTLNAQNIFLMGRVNDLSSLYSHGADLIINPVHLGGGLKIKNVEALVSSLPLITTTEGANGLEDGINDAFLLANSVKEWIDAIIAVMLSDTLRKKLSKNAYLYAKNHFSEQVCYDELILTLMKENNIPFDSHIPIGHPMDTHQKQYFVPSSTPSEESIVETIAALYEDVDKTRKQMQQKLDQFSASELSLYKEALDALITTNIFKHPILKLVRYRTLIEHFGRLKHHTNNTSSNKLNQELLNKYREKLQVICDKSSKRNPLKKIYALRQLIQWHKCICK